MKRFLCMLICVLMLCAGARAEAFQGHITWDTEAQGALDYLEATSQDDVKQLSKLAEAMEELANGLDISFGWQDDGVYGMVSLKDTTLLDMAVWADGDQAVLVTNLLPGHYLDISAAPEDSAASQAALERLENMDWHALLADAVVAVDDWCAGLAMTEEYGNFVGDAYEGGVYRKSYTFDDMAIAQLVKALAGTLDKHGINDALLEDYLGENGLISSFVRWNDQIGKDNKHSYVLHQVYGLEELPIGYSLVVLENGEQVATVSVATAHNGWRAIWGYGLNGRNYYIGAEMICGELPGETTFTLVVYHDPMKAGFLAVEPFVENILLMIDSEISVQKNSWQAEIEVLDPMASIVDTYYVLDSQWQADGSSELSLAWYLSEDDGRADTPMQKISITVEPCDPQAWTIEDMTAIPMDAYGGATELIDSLVEESMQDMLVKLFRLVPTQLLTMLLTL